MTLFYYDHLFQEHQTGNHPESPARLEAVTKHLQWVGLDAMCRRPTWEPISAERLALVHDADYVRRCRAFVEAGGGWIEQDTYVCPRSFEVACSAAGAVGDAVARVIDGDDKRAFCLVRPPGHHARPQNVMGFCLFNNVALGARIATREMGVDRVLIVDWDVHHGNGTQDAFWEDEQVGFLSIHRFPFYPGTGAAEETGAGQGLGTIVNLPIAYGTSREDYFAEFERALFSLASKIQPQLVIVSAGFDAHRDDPIGSLGLVTEDFTTLTQTVLKVADEYAGGALVSVLEGGYNPGALSDCVDAHLQALLQE